MPCSRSACSRFSTALLLAASASCAVAASVELPENDQQPSRGVRITRVWPGSPAEEVGLESGDIVLAIDGRRITSLEEFSRALRAAWGDARLTVVNVRNQQTERLYVDTNRLGRIGVSAVETMVRPRFRDIGRYPY